MAEKVGMMRALMASSGGPGAASAWSALWKNDLTLWDLGKPTDAMLDEMTKAVTQSKVPASGARVLIPGCGSGYDCLALAKLPYGMHVTGLDIAPEAIARAEKLIREATSSSSIDSDSSSTSSSASSTTYVPPSLICGDFFTSPALLHESFDIIFDYTFFCALPPSLRAQWGRRTAQLLKPGGRLLTLAFPLAPDELALSPDAAGPPFPVSLTAYTNALTRSLSPADGSVSVSVGDSVSDSVGDSDSDVGVNGRDPGMMLLSLESGPYSSDLSARRSSGVEAVIWWRKD